MIENGDSVAENGQPTPGNRSGVLTWLGTHKISAVLLAVLTIIIAMIAFSPSEPAQAQSTAPATMAQPSAPAITEDSPAFDCRVDGNHLCGPNNSNGATPGYYQDGALYADWDHARWMAYGMRVALDGPAMAPAAAVTVAATPDGPIVGDPGFSANDTLPRHLDIPPAQAQDDQAPAQDDPYGAQAQAPAGPDRTAPSGAASQPDAPQATGGSGSGSASGTLDPAMISQLLQMAGGSAGSGNVDSGQIMQLLSQMDPAQLQQLLGMARQACQVIK
jgi:hypothetical protein